MIHTSTHRLNNILDDLLRISRATHGSINLISINISSTINEVINSLKHSDLAKGVLFDVIGDEFLEFNTDKDFIISIFQNLISNAVKYSDKSKKDKKIEIKYELNNQFLLVKITDNGIGIPIKNQEKIFDMFYRANNTSVDGNGLGLYIVKSTLNKLDGEISFVSKELEGSTFIIKLLKK